jgi:plasmid stabilization system protein ParE
MPKKIIWSPDSERDLEHILEYLSRKWETSVAVRFLDIIEDLTEQISINPRQFPVIHLKLNIRKCVITKHNTLYYRNKRNHVELLRIYDNRQDPSKLKFE